MSIFVVLIVLTVVVIGVILLTVSLVKLSKIKKEIADSYGNESELKKRIREETQTKE